MIDNISIRRGRFDDAERISRFLILLSEDFIVGEFTAEGRAYFLADLRTAEMERRLTGDFRFYLAEHGGDLAGVAAIRGNTHLYYLFTGTPYHGQGLARRLWLHAKEEALALGNPGRFTVNASNYAVGAYEKLGFRRSEPARERNGVLYNPMEFPGSG